jgi:outer membrane protein OmpA-like peptidoglycan-associated protein
MVTPPRVETIEVPAVTKTVKKVVMVTPPTTKTVEIPAQYKTVKKVVMVTPPTTKVIEIPAKTKTYKRVVVATPATTKVIDIPAKSTNYKVTNVSPESTEVVEIPAKMTTFKKTVMVTPPQAVAKDVPAKTAVIKKVVLAKDAYVTETTVPAKYKTVKKEVLVQKGGLTTWKPVDCALLEYSPLPIKWNLGSATLTPAAKKLIDSRLLPILKDGKMVEIASHTDSRGSASSNQNLSERRARAVVNYLMAKGINASQLVAKGYGESRLTNRCSDGVSCTEKEHAANRRTSFRVINAK